MYKVFFKMPGYNKELTHMVCPECAEVFLNWSEEERIKRENNKRLRPWAYEYVKVEELHPN
jgi:hypothetical protein